MRHRQEKMETDKQLNIEAKPGLNSILNNRKLKLKEITKHHELKMLVQMTHNHNRIDLFTITLFVFELIFIIIYSS